MSKFQIVEYTGRKNWAHVTDGKHVMYVQWNGEHRGFSISTTHKPNTRTGTGFHLAEYISDADLLPMIAKSITDFAPHWANSSDCASVTKYKDAQEYMEYERKFREDAHLVPFTIEAIKQ